MTNPSYPIVAIGDVPVVDAPPEIDVSNASWFRVLLLDAARRGHATVVVKLSDSPT